MTEIKAIKTKIDAGTFTDAKRAKFAKAFKATEDRVRAKRKFEDGKERSVGRDRVRAVRGELVQRWKRGNPGRSGRRTGQHPLHAMPSRLPGTCGGL